MKAIIQTAALQRAIGIVGKVVPSRCIKPVLQCLRIDGFSTTGKVVISGTDLEFRAVTNIAAVEVETPGACLVDSARLGQIMKLANSDIITIESDDKFAVTICLDGRTYKLLGYDPADFPGPQTADAGEAVILSPEQIARIASVVPLAAKAHSHYAMSAVLLECGKRTCAVATDGHRLGVVKLDTPDGTVGFTALVPPRMFQLIGAAMLDDDSVTLAKTDTALVASTADSTFTAPIIQGNFPKWQDVVPQSNPRATVEKSAFIDAVRAASVMTGEDSKGVKIAIFAGKATLTARQSESGEANVTMPITAETDFTAAFNPAFITEGLAVITSESVGWTQAGSLKPALFAGGDAQIVVMPVEVG